MWNTSVSGGQTITYTVPDGAKFVRAEFRNSTEDSLWIDKPNFHRRRRKLATSPPKQSVVRLVEHVE